MYKAGDYYGMRVKTELLSVAHISNRETNLRNYKVKYTRFAAWSADKKERD